MKIAFLVCEEVYAPRVLDLLDTCAIDYYTQWEHVKGRGHGTESHLGTRSFPGMNVVFMIAFEEEAALEALVGAVTSANEKIPRQDDRIRLFQVPLEKIV